MQKNEKFKQSTIPAGPSSASSTGNEQTQPTSISEVESLLPPLRGENAAFGAHMDHRNAYSQVLDEFYNGGDYLAKKDENAKGPLFKKHKWDAKRARKAEFQRIADSLLRMVGGSIGAKRDEDNKVIIGVGLAKFQSTSGLSSLDGTFQSYFVRLARSLGYIVVGVNEYYSSKKCPSCKGFVARTESFRRLYCDNCQKYMHRDVMAGHNLCNAMRGHLEKGERPEYLQPVDDDGNFQWKQEHKRDGDEDDAKDNGRSNRQELMPQTPEVGRKKR
ncbi:hypothetical protein DFQ27_002121, partial [Actinomortierella ambigua]